MKKVLYFFMIILLGISHSSFGQESEINKDIENIAGQYAECAAYYEIVYFAMKSSNKKEETEIYAKVRETANIYSLLLASINRNEKMAAQVTNSRIEMYLKVMKQEANNDNANISILINKYHFGCQEAMENPSSYLSEIL